MRLIGHLPDESSARVLRDYLFAQGIENNVEHEAKDSWAVWITDEDRIPQAAKILEEYKAKPDDPKFKAHAGSAKKVLSEKQKDQEAYEKKLRGRRYLFQPLTGYGFGPLTFLLIVASITVFVLSRFGTEDSRIMGLFITGFESDAGYIKWLKGLPEVRSGQVWRLVTPMLIHYGPLHILFNMLWLRDLGSMIEGRQSTWHLLGLVIGIAAISNYAQYFFVGPNFGGMSGVIYGLLGYVWIRGKMDPGSGLFLHQSTVMMMMIWFVICLVGLMPGVANVAHAAGLACGVAWGYLSSLRYR